jgi:hypothetical protein
MLTIFAAKPAGPRGLNRAATRRARIGRPALAAGHRNQAMPTAGWTASPGVYYVGARRSTIGNPGGKGAQMEKSIEDIEAEISLKLPPSRCRCRSTARRATKPIAC